jgi:hypothetical protein
MQGVKKVPGPLLFPHAPHFTLIHICRPTNDDDVSEAMIMNFGKRMKD